MANDTGQAFEACAKIRREERVENFLQARDRSAIFLNIVPPDGMASGWLYMSSPDCFSEWSVVTVQDRVTVETNRRCGPASWSRVWISGGAAASVFVPAFSSFGIDQATGLVSGADPDPRVKAWFLPYSENEAFETLQFSLGANPWDSFPQLAGGANQNIGYPPRLCRALYAHARGTITANLGVDFNAYGQVNFTNQVGIWVDSWTSVNFLNAGPGGSNVLASWANTPVSLINP